MARSPFFYVGDKYKLIEQLATHFPNKINTLIEPFCGGGSVFLNVGATKYIANDKNDYMIQLHNFLFSFRNKREIFFNMLENEIKKYNLSASALGTIIPNELKIKYVKTYYAVYNKESYRELKSDFNNNKSDLIKLYMLIIYGFNHMLRFNSKGDFNLPVGNVDYNKNVIKALNDYFDFTSQNEICFVSSDFLVFLNNYKYENDDLVYLDPPYLISNCEYNKGWKWKNDIELLNALDELNSKGIKFALSNVIMHKGNKNNFLALWSRKYNVYDNIKSNYISYRDNTVKDTVEVLITNY
ncbi:MAG: Dam family site-specific DNA-(adenine-N6)-methyltransferase [Acholeplasmatales bacterium]|jgi:DNA adenine methylase|nr:Dam family site-specific DNA-(adenine-N6)-methyltransferase [Acholeplasmatales bacterium]